MNGRKLGKIRRLLEQLQSSPKGIKPDQLESIAKKLGRRKAKRGKEPNYIRDDEPVLCPPLSIPNHAELKQGTARSIIEALLSDVDTWQMYLDQNRPNPDQGGDDDDEEDD